MPFQINDRVLVPALRLGINDSPTALYATTVLAFANKSIQVRLPNGSSSNPIGSSLCHKDFGILVLCVGDWDTELALLDPLAKSILQFLRLIASDDYIRAIKVRSLEELSRYWNTNQRGYSHVILIGHGRPNGLKFAVDGWVSANVLAERLSENNPSPKTFISLSCQSGYQAFASEFSSKAFCSNFIAPFHSVHGAIASQFSQTFLAYHVIQGETVKVAHRHARSSVPGTTSFRLWKGGGLQE